MFKQLRFDFVRLPLLGLAMMVAQAASNLATPVQAQGFYFESWSNGYGGRWGGIELGIGVRPSSPVYGVRPSQIFPPIGVRPYGFGGPVVPFGFRDTRADYYDRLYRQYRAELDSPYRYGIDPRPQAGFNELQRSWAVPPLSVVPPVATIEPFLPPGEVDPRQPAGATLSVEEVAAQLRSAAQRLSVALARRGEEGQIWSDYLAPDTILRVLDEGTDPRELGTLLSNYDGVVGNGSLRWVMRTDGFAETRQWLHQYLLAVQAADADRAAAGEQAVDPQPTEPQTDEAPVEGAGPAADELPPPPPMPDPPAQAVSPSGGVSL
jgi:hypothetical protein